MLHFLHFAILANWAIFVEWKMRQDVMSFRINFDILIILFLVGRVFGSKWLHKLRKLIIRSTGLRVHVRRA